jgi:hypothetical protein
MSQTSYSQHALNENNILIMSGENHIRFDGYDPKIAIMWVSETDRTVTVHGEDLTYCNIQIVCVNEEVFRCVKCSVKSGTASDLNTLTCTTTVAVSSPALFRQFLTFKYMESVGLQQSAGSENQAVKMARVRTGVTQKMQDEFEGLSIDLQLTPKNKRAIAAVSGDD